MKPASFNFKPTTTRRRRRSGSLCCPVCSVPFPSSEGVLAQQDVAAQHVMRCSAERASASKAVRSDPRREDTSPLPGASEPVLDKDTNSHRTRSRTGASGAGTASAMVAKPDKKSPEQVQRSKSRSACAAQTSGSPLIAYVNGQRVKVTVNFVAVGSAAESRMKTTNEAPDHIHVAASGNESDDSLAESDSPSEKYSSRRQGACRKAAQPAKREQHIQPSQLASKKSKGPKAESSCATKEETYLRSSTGQHPSMFECPVCLKVFHKADVSVTEINHHVLRCSDSQSVYMHRHSPPQANQKQRAADATTTTAKVVAGNRRESPAAGRGSNKRTLPPSRAAEQRQQPQPEDTSRTDSLMCLAKRSFQKTVAGIIISDQSRKRAGS